VLLRASVALAALWTAVFLVSAEARASVVLDLDVTGLVARAGHVLRGVVESERIDEPRPGQVVTLYSVRVIERWKGESPATVVVRQPGGQSGERSLQVAGAARMRPGEQVVLFLEASRGAHVPLTMAGGVFHLEGGRARRHLAGLQLLPTGAEGIPEELSIERLEQWIRSAVGR
jgi:hypothetical protein